MSLGFRITPARAEDAAQIARIWHEGWCDAHIGLVPEALQRVRTYASFADRTQTHLGRTRVVLDGDKVLGFCMIKDAELYQMYVDRAVRGTGAARHLISDAETQIAQAGHQSAWLACAIGNIRAMRFYEKKGWVNVGQEEVALETSDGPFAIKLLRYEKRLLD